MATTKGKLHEAFKNRLVELREQAAAQAAAARGTGQRRWQVPASLTTELSDIPKLHEPAFNRDEINANYEEALAGGDLGGTVGDAMSLKLQIDYNAAEERAFRSRHSSLSRSLAHATARRRGHGHVRGIFQSVQRSAENLLRAGGVSTVVNS